MMSFTDLILLAVVFLCTGWSLWGIFARAAQRKVAGDILFRRNRSRGERMDSRHSRFSAIST